MAANIITQPIISRVLMLTPSIITPKMAENTDSRLIMIDATVG